MPFNDIKIFEVEEWMENMIYTSIGDLALNLCEIVDPAAGY